MRVVPTAVVPNDDSRPLPVVVVGAGAMSGAWLDAVDEIARTRLVGVVDLDVAAARRATAGRGEVMVGDDLVAVTGATGARAVVDVTSPAAHHAVTTTALRAGLPVLGEKPVAATLAEALSLAATARVTGQRFMVSQSRRWNPHVFRLRRAAAAIGPIGTVTVSFFRAPHFGGFREEMDDPMLVDMAIHAFDTIRFVLADEPASVTCDTWNPPWSWYDGDASGTATFTMAAGARATWTGSWCAPGHPTSWNGTWRLSGANGTVTWDGEGDPVVTAADGHDLVLDAPPDLQHDAFAAALAAFADALDTGAAPNGDVHENIASMAMVATAVRASRRGGSVDLRDVLADAHARALAQESDPDVATELASWDHPDDVLTTWDP